MQNDWKKVDWRHTTSIYEVNTRQYTTEGSFEAFREHIPRLHEMGIGTLWFMPVTPISVKGRKGSLGSYYACSDYVSVNPEFGTMDEFKAIVRDAHDRGMKVIIDWVANHTGCDHRWTMEHTDFYKRNGEGQFYDAHGWDDVIDLDYTNGAMRMKMIESMAYWVREADIDGFRCDMAMLVEVGFWKQAREALDLLKPLFWLAELDQWDDPEYLEVFDAAYSWHWMHATQDHYKSGSWDIRGLKDVLEKYATLQPSGSMRTWFTSNHDENTWNGSEYEKYGALAIPLAVFTCTWDGIPLVYSGQELPNLKRLEFFDKDPINWSSTPQLHDLYAKLLHLRREHPALRSGDGAVRTEWLAGNDHEPLLAYERSNAGRSVMVILNLSAQPQKADLDGHGPHGKYTELFTGRTWDTDHDLTSVVLPWACQVWIDQP
jgi:alpha-amylase